MKQLTLLFLRRDDEILLAMKKRGFGEGLWNGVGGKLNDNETVEQAAIRECQEEINVTPLELDKVGLLNFLDQTMGEMIVSIFISRQWEGDPKESEEMKPKWYKVNNLPFNTMWQDDPYWLPKIIEGKKIKGRFEFDKDNNITDYRLSEVESI